MSEKHPAPFTVRDGCENYHVIDDNGFVMATCESRFDSELREFFDHADALARAEQIAAALNTAFYLAKIIRGDE